MRKLIKTGNCVITTLQLRLHFFFPERVTLPEHNTPVFLPHILYSTQCSVTQISQFRLLMNAKKKCQGLQLKITVVFRPYQIFLLTGVIFEGPPSINHLTPNGHYMGRTAQLTSRCSILYIYSTNIRTEYFKHAA